MGPRSERVGQADEFRHDLARWLDDHRSGLLLAAVEADGQGALDIADAMLDGIRVRWPEADDTD